MLQQSTATVLILLSLHHSNVHAFPTSAGNCPKGIAAVGGSHLQFGPDFDNRPGRAGTLESEGITLSIGGTVLQPGVTASFPEATDLEWTIKAVDTAVPYEGVALRVEADESNTFTLTVTSDGLDELTQCDFEAGNVLGIEHRNKDKKTTSAGVVRFDLTGPVSIDLTVVFTNGDSDPPDNQSIYAHTAYSINIGAPVVTPAPVSAVTPAPVSAVTPPPVSVGTPAPVTTPIDLPVAAPVEVPIAVPVDAPVEAPIEAPVESPVEAPIETSPPVETPATEPPLTSEPPNTTPPATEPPATEPPATEPPASTEPPDEGDTGGKGGKGDKQGKGKGDKEGKGKGDKESKEKGKGKGKKAKKDKGKKAPKAGGSEKKGKDKGSKGDGKGDVRRRRLQEQA
jgi:hypothetical protein